MSAECQSQVAENSLVCRTKKPRILAEESERSTCGETDRNFLHYITGRVCTTKGEKSTAALHSKSNISSGNSGAHIKRAKGLEPSTFTLAT